MLHIDLHLSYRLTMRWTHWLHEVGLLWYALFSIEIFGHSVQHDTPSMYANFSYE